ncbi:MAG: carboxypeptidase regulatory-like domain-containing protein [Acidobacteriota bacterium]|nr:carboxypeptidase regulatory-like domain-containing protein [Acidobacteriota bacterium]
MLRLTVSFCCILIVAQFAFGQAEQASVTGSVTDVSKAIIPDAQVTVRNLATNVTARTTTNSAGLYYVRALTPGAYELTVEKSGFRSSKVQQIPLTVGLTATVDVTMQVGTVSESVEVTASAVQLESQTSGMGTVVNTRPVSELPLLGRNPLSFAALAPGVIPTSGQQANGGGTIGVATTSQIGGGLAQQNGVLIDGAESRGTTEGGNSFSLPVEAVAEVKIETTTYAANLGRAAGGIINIATKSGTDQFHGTAYEFLRNSHLNANGWQNDRNGIAKTLFQRNLYGANLGGPIIRDRTFFFFNYEAVRQGAPDQVLGTVPTAAQRAGDFSQTRDRNGNLDIIYDPSTTRPDPSRPGQFIRDPFPGNIIPAARINGISSKVVQFYPDPNRPGTTAQGVNNYLRTGKSVTNTNNYFARVDHLITQKHHLFGRFGYTPFASFSTLPGEVYASRGVSSNPGTQALLSLTSTFSPNVIGEARLSYTRLQFNSFPKSQGFDIKTLGFGPPLTDNILYKQFPVINVQTYNTGSGLSVTQAAPTDFDMLGGATRGLDPQDTWQAQYHFTIVRGRQNIKFGTDLQLIKLNAYNSQYADGQFNFDRVYTQGPDPNQTTLNGGNGLASLLLGIPVASTLTLQYPLFLYQKFYAGYFQDDYRVSTKLTLNLGLRYEYTTPYAEKFGQIGYFDYNGIEPTTGLKGVYKSTKPGGYQENPQRRNFEPRVGIAYQLNSKTVLRAAGAIFYATYVGVNASSTDFGTGGFVSDAGSLGNPSPYPNTPPPGGSWNNPFVFGIQQPGKGSFVGQNVRGDQLDRPSPYLSNWTFNVQREITPSLLAEVGYVGSKMTHLFWNRQHNQNDPALLSLGSRLTAQTANPFFGTVTTGILGTPTVQLRQLLRPYPQYGDILIFRDPYADMNYESMTVRIQKQYSHGFLFTLGYTLSKTIASTAQSNTWVVGPSNALYNAKYNRGLEANDCPQRLVMSYIYDVPFGKGKRMFTTGVPAWVLGGWEASGISVFQAGRPILIQAPDQTNLLNFIATNGRADRLKDAVLPSGQTLSHWFDTTAFKTAAPFTVPTDSLSQPDLRGPRRINTDFSLIKNNRFREHYNVQFRAEFFNVFNHPQLEARGATTDLTNAQFGQIVLGGGDRNIQFGLRVVF